jgi:hypothetical protein
VLAQLGTRGLVPLELATLVIAQDQPKVHTAVQQGETHTPVSFREREDPLVVLDAGGLKGFDRIAGGFGGFAVPRDPAKGLLRQVGRQTKPSAHVVVQHRLHPHDVDDALRDGRVDIRAGVCKGLQRGIDVRRFFGSRLDFACQCQDLFHTYKGISMLTWMQEEKAVAASAATNFSSPCLKPGGSEIGRIC